MVWRLTIALTGVALIVLAAVSGTFGGPLAIVGAALVLVASVLPRVNGDIVLGPIRIPVGGPDQEAKAREPDDDGDGV